MSKKGAAYPSKTKINLVMREKKAWRLSRVVLAFAALGLAVALFGKVAVADRLAEVMRQKQALAELKEQVSAVQEELAGYDETAQLYGRYWAGWMTDGERAAVDRVDILDLIEQELMAAATVQQVTISGNVLTVELFGVTLEETSHIVKQIETWSQVSTVTVYTASSRLEEEKRAQVSMIVTLHQPVEGGGGT